MYGSRFIEKRRTSHGPASSHHHLPAAFRALEHARRPRIVARAQPRATRLDRRTPLAQRSSPKDQPDHDHHQPRRARRDRRVHQILSVLRRCGLDREQDQRNSDRCSRDPGEPSNQSRTLGPRRRSFGSVFASEPLKRIAFATRRVASRSWRYGVTHACERSGDPPRSISILLPRVRIFRARLRRL